MPISSTHLWLCLLAGLGACVLPGVDERASAPVVPVALNERLLELEPDLAPLRDSFNAAVDRVRLVALLSPSCPTCELGATAVRESVLAAYPTAKLRVMIVWIDVSTDDDRARAALSVGTFADPRVRHFHDPLQRAGRVFAEGLLPTGFAWDTYLLYPPGVLWDDLPPRPSAWASQLGRIAGENFHPRAELFLELSRAAAELLGAPESAR